MASESHIGDLAELYAAGALDDRDRASVEAHIARCPECLRRTGEAEEVILALERRFKIRDNFDSGAEPLTLTRRSTPFWTILAVAAALVVGFLIPHPAVRQNLATLAMIQSHFSHAQFGGEGPSAKVVYARDRSWYYVLVEGSHRYDVYGIRAGQAQLLGSTQAAGPTSDLFVKTARQFDAVELRENGRTIERAVIR
jgi:hypothetical protein